MRSDSELAEDAGLDPRWIADTLRAIERNYARIRRLAAKIAADLTTELPNRKKVRPICQSGRYLGNALLENSSQRP